MKCEVIQDLIPLYVDECCSKESKRLVEEHIETCSECREILRKMKCGPDLLLRDEEENIREEQLLLKGKEIIRNEVKRDYYRIIAMIDFVVNFLLTELLIWQRGFMGLFEYERESAGYVFGEWTEGIWVLVYLAPLLMIADVTYLYLLHKKKQPNISENLFVFSFAFKMFWFMVGLVIGVVVFFYRA